MREGLTRLPLIFLLAAFCLPLFVGLGRTELGNDEAIYSYAVESILDSGDWLSPKASPDPDFVFLEKPPLKFWIVAAPIRIGLLPHDEFGLRFWDAVFGSLAFIYVFVIGRRLAGPICGAVALLILFGHEYLLFEHGLRSNNMEAPLVLAYCGGIHHYLAWRSAGSVRRRWLHIAAFAAFFYLGFMTKFVAALFLPLVAGAAAVLLPGHRRQLLLDHRRWLVAAGLVVAAILPWFVYQSVQRGDELWNVMVGEHVYKRFTAYTDPGHLGPWHFYLTEGWLQLGRSGSAPWVVFGLILLALHTVRRRMPDGAVVLLWLVLPVGLMSLGTSKLYHYFYPYLPPLALAGGYGVAWLVSVAARLARTGPGARLAGRLATGGRGARSAWRRRIFLPLMYLALLVAVVTVIEPIHLQLGGRTLFTNHSIARPLIMALGFASLAGQFPLALGGGAALVLSLLIPTPLDGYRDSLGRLTTPYQPLRALGACLRDVDASRRARGAAVFEPYTPVSEAFLHSQFYYVRGSGWLDQDVDHERLQRALFSPGEERPVLIDATRYDHFLQRLDPAQPLPPGISRPGIVVLLPGDYSVCRLVKDVRVQ